TALSLKLIHIPELSQFGRVAINFQKGLFFDIAKGSERDKTAWQDLTSMAHKNHAIAVADAETMTRRGAEEFIKTLTRLETLLHEVAAVHRRLHRSDMKRAPSPAVIEPLVHLLHRFSIGHVSHL